MNACRLRDEWCMCWMYSGGCVGGGCVGGGGWMVGGLYVCLGVCLWVGCVLVECVWEGEGCVGGWEYVSKDSNMY